MLKSNSNPFVCAFLLLVLTYSACGRSYAEPTDAQPSVSSNTDAATVNGDGPDDPHLTNGPIASLDLPNSNAAIRTIDIYPAVSQSSTKFYHTPIFALMINPNPLPRLPDISYDTPTTLWGVNRASDNTNITVLTFRVLLSTPVLDTALRQSMETQDYNDKSIDFQRINIAAYPIRTLSVKLIDPLATSENQEIGESVVMTPIGHDDSYCYVRIFVPTSKLSGLFKSFLNKIDGPELVWTYSFINYQQKYAKAEQLSQEDVSKALDNIISASQTNSNAPIFQNQVQELIEKLDKVVKNTITSNSADLLPIVKIDPDEILKPDVIDLTKPLDTTDEDALQKFLLPLLQKYQDETDHRQETEHTTTKTIKVGANIGVQSSAFNLDQTAIDQLKNTDGVETKQSNSGDFLEPYKISVYRRQSDYQSVASEVVKQVYIASGFQSVTSTQSPLPMTFTDQTALISPENAVAYSGTSLGMSFCYFGNELPSGYVYADGKSKWPEASWVPRQLWNQPIQDMNGTVIAATNTLASVGTIATGGEIPAIPFSQAFTALASKSDTAYVLVGTLQQKYKLYTPGSDWPVEKTIQDVFTTNGDQINQTPYEMMVTSAEIPSEMAGTLSATIGPISLGNVLPERTLCRWVVRVY